MKKKYFFQKLKRTSNIFAMIGLLGYANIHAQTEYVSVEITAGTPGALTWYAVNEEVTMTGTATLTRGATFDVSFKVSPATGQMLGYNDSGWGMTTVTADNNTFRASTAGYATLDDIQTSNYTGGVTSSNIMASTFTHASVVDAINNADRFTYQVNGNEYISVGDFSNIIDNGDGTTTELGNPTSVNLLTHGPVDIAGGSALISIPSFVIKTGSTRTQASDRWTIGSVTVSVTVDTSSLGLDDLSNLANSFKLYPNPAKDNVSLNMPIYSAEILDITGKIVKTFTNKIEKLDVSNFASGLYILKGVSVEGTPLIKRFVKRSK